MTRIRFGRLAVAGLAVALTFALATHGRADIKAIESAIHRSAHIPLTGAAPTGQPRGGAAKKASVATASASSTFLRLKESLTGAKAQRVRAVKLSTGQPSTSTQETVGSAPAGFASTFNWDRSTQSALLVVLVNPADPTGVMITGLEPGDTIQVLSASGLASFSKNTGHPGLSSLVAFVADGTAAVVSALVPGAKVSQPIEAAGQVAAKAFQGSGNPEKFRDSFGVDPSSHGVALQEGGVIVCLPQSGGPYFSADSGHRSYWATNPPVVGEARGLPTAYKSLINNPPFFFIGQGTPNAGVCQTNDPAYLLAWDYNFQDNSGLYEVYVQLTQAGSFSAPPIFKSAGKSTAKK
jgi:hypothetical protein